MLKLWTAIKFNNIKYHVKETPIIPYRFVIRIAVFKRESRKLIVPLEWVFNSENLGTSGYKKNKDRIET